MTDNQKTDKPRIIGPALMGAAVGTAVTAGVVMLSDEKKRKKIIKNMHGIKDKAMDTMQKAKGKFEEMRGETG